MRTVVLSVVGILLSLQPVVHAQWSPTAEVVLGFNGGAVWTSQTTGICLWYFPVIADLDSQFLFATGADGKPVIDRQHAYLLWVSDFSVVPLEAKEPFAAALVPTGTATIYFKADPTTRDFSDMSKRSSWGSPVAQFTRKASIIRSPDAWASDTFVFSASLVSSEAFSIGKDRFDLRLLVPNGFTCFEQGQTGSSWEAGSCVGLGQLPFFTSAGGGSENTVALKGIIGGTQAEPVPDVSCPASHPLRVPVTGSGVLTRLGQVTDVQSHCINPSGTDFSFTNGRFAFTAANGDTLIGTYSGVLKPTSNPKILEIMGTALFTGGTGQLQGVTGTSLAGGTVNLETQEAQLLLDGAINLLGGTGR
jgi:hypothetical protein